MDFIQKFVFFVFLVFGSVSQAEVYDVSTTAELREALASAAEAGGDNTIRLAAGTYSTQDDDEGTFNYLSQQGGSLEVFGSEQSSVILDGGSLNSIFKVFDEAEQLTLSLNNLVFQNSLGDAVEITHAREVKITNNTFRLNKGAASVDIHKNVDKFSVTSSLFEGNEGECPALRLIGPADITEITDSVFTENEGSRAGAICDWYDASTYGAKINISESSFIDNVVSSPTRGNHITQVDTDISITSSVFSNTQRRSAADIQCSYPCTAGYVTITNSKFSNVDVRLGSRTVVYNSIFLGSSLRRFSPTTYNNPIDIQNNLLVQSELKLTKPSDDNIVNNVLVESRLATTTAGFPEIYNNYYDPSLVDSDLSVSGDGNIFEGVNLGFLNAEEGDYRLTSSSGLIDAGTTDPELAYITDYDYTGTTARVIGSSIDIGPYEYDGEAPPDSDGDGLNDNIDNCPSIANEDQADNDSDGEGDACDSDDDNDGTNDEDDAFPFDDTESLDTDSDGIGNNEDEDDDGDGFLDDSDPQPIIANVFAIDSDGDGVADSIDDYPTDATKQFSSDGDFDGDGYSNDEEVDYCTNPFDKNSQPDVGGLSAWMLYLGTQEQDAQ